MTRSSPTAQRLVSSTWRTTVRDRSDPRLPRRTVRRSRKRITLRATPLTLLILAIDLYLYICLILYESLIINIYFQSASEIWSCRHASPSRPLWRSALVWGRPRTSTRTTNAKVHRKMCVRPNRVIVKGPDIPHLVMHVILNVDNINVRFRSVKEIKASRRGP